MRRQCPPRRRRSAGAAVPVDLLDQVHDGVVATDLTAPSRTGTRLAERIYGYTAAEIIGQSVTVSISPRTSRPRVE